MCSTRGISISHRLRLEALWDHTGFSGWSGCAWCYLRVTSACLASLQRSTAWRGTPTELILQPSGGVDTPESVKRVRELTVYDADGSAMRFLAFINSEPNDVSPFAERWIIVPTKGVQASLEAIVDETGSIRGFVLRGGPPGRIREGGE